MHYLNRFKDLDTHNQHKLFLELCKNPLEVQQTVLQEILKINKNCEYGEKFKFSSIDCIEEYQQRVPISTWDDYKAYSLKMKNGEQNLLFFGKTKRFTITSGTTGKNKLLPDSPQGALIKAQISFLRDTTIISSFPNLLKGKFISMANSSSIGITSAGIPIGSASGLTTSNTDKDLLKLLAFPPCIKEIEEQLSCDYALMRFAIQEDVRAITGNNAGRIPLLLEVAKKYKKEILKDIREGTLSNKFKISKKIRIKLTPYLKPNPKRADELEVDKPFLPEFYWENLKIIKCWLSGSVGEFVKTLDPFLKNHPNKITFFDAGYGASEGKFNLPIKPNTPYAPIVHFGAFYEFLPLDDENSKFLLLHQLKDKKEYRLFITNYSGLYRYDMKDIIRVDGFTHATPNISFISKTSDIANIAGEKIGAAFFQKCCYKNLKKFNQKLIHFCVILNKKELTYDFYIEIEESKNSISEDAIQKEFMDYFYKNNIVYKTFCEQNLLKPLSINFMKKGWQDALYKEQEKKGLTRSQIKLPVIYNTLPLSEFKC